MTNRLSASYIHHLLLVIFFILLVQSTQAQAPLPFAITNNSPFPDSEIYVAIVGEDFSGNHVWIDCKTSGTNLMYASYNTVQGPVYNGDLGPGGNGKYAACFSKLSEIPNKTVMLPPIQGCRMFISVNQQLYFYFFGANGAVRGYSTPSHTNPNDPNKGIRYEMMELTYNHLGFWGNTSRVDSYNYPMGLEVHSSNGTVAKTGELKTHAQIGAEFLASVPEEFKGCYDPTTGIIMQPTKTKDFADGSVGTMPVPGPYVNYMKPYIDAIWNKYTNEDLLFTTLEGTWKGRIVNDRLEITCTSGAYAGRKGIIERRPTTQEALEGKGVLDRVIGDGMIDLYVQSQICAAITRHVINVTTPNVGTQSWSDPSKYYLESPCNHYAKFWHRADISVDKKSYGFAYDDVNNQSSTLHSTSPTKAIVIFGGYASSNNPPVVAITAPADNANYTAPANITINASASDTDGSITKVEFFNGGQKLGEDNSSPYTYTWNNVTAGTYTITAVASDNGGSTKTSTPITVKVTIPQSPYGGTRWAIPGTIEAENYDLGGQDVAYNDVTTTNDGGAYRTDAVDIEAINGGGYNVGYIANGEWMEYLVNVNTTGLYTIEAMVAATAPGKTFRLELDGTAIGTFNVPNTGGWQAFQKIALNNIALPAGQKVLRLVATSDEFNIDKLSFSLIPSNQPPTVTITAPVNGTTYIAPAAITITATASDGDGTITKVAFYNNGSKIGEDSNSPYSINLTNVAAGTYTITAVATDNQGSAKTSDPVTITVNSNQKPVISITSPVNGTSYIAPASITLTASASDADGSITKVEFYNGNDKLAEDNNSPYSFNWSAIGAGTYTITAIATDNLGATTTSTPVTITVNENQKPTVNITAPANGTTYIAPANYTITATATDNDGTITKVEFYNGNTKLGEDASSPYAYSLSNLSAGTYVITAKAFDNLGASTTSSIVTITVNENQKPTVSITAPASQSTYMAPATISFTATALDMDGTITKLEFYSGAQKLGEDNSSPYTFIWTNVTPGTYIITAKAIDNLGASTTSEAITIIVNANQAPSVTITSPIGGTSFIAPVSIALTASANDADGTISKVEFFNNGVKLGEDVAEPFTFHWENLPAGNYLITAKATDNLGSATTSSAIAIYVVANKAPWVSITAPSNNANYLAPANISIITNASDTDGSINKVEFFNDGLKIGEANESPYTITWYNVAPGAYTITAKATDNLGMETLSSGITIIVSENQAPSVSITSPITKATFSTPGNITINASATDTDGHISKVEFYNGNEKIGEDISFPYFMEWTDVTSGTYTVTAIATDNLGKTATSTPVDITVSNVSATMTASNTIIQFAPNPVTDIITFSVNKSSTVSLYNHLGHLLLSETKVEPNGTLDISYLPAGMYVIKIDTGWEISINSLIKN